MLLSKGFRLFSIGFPKGFNIYKHILGQFFFLVFIYNFVACLHIQFAIYFLFKMVFVFAIGSSTQVIKNSNTQKVLNKIYALFKFKWKGIYWVKSACCSYWIYPLSNNKHICDNEIKSHVVSSIIMLIEDT